MESIIELQRQNHEEIERFQRALTGLLSQSAPTHKQALSNEHKAAQILDRVQTRYLDLHRQYSDQDARRQELESLSAPASNQQGDLSQFYARLVKIQEHHRKYPDSVVDGFQLELAGILDPGAAQADGEEVEEVDPLAYLFGGEEAYGRYLDLHTNYTAYNNLRNLKRRLSYLQYLDVVLSSKNTPLHSELSLEIRSSADYESYIASLLQYLKSYKKRTSPLEDLETTQAAAEIEFIAEWDAGPVDGWTSKTAQGASEAQGEGIWCAACQKLYSKQTVYDAHLKSRKHLKNVEKAASDSAVPPSNPNGPDASAQDHPHRNSRTRPFKAALQTKMSEILIKDLFTKLTDTKANVERRFALTARERELEQTEPQTDAPAPATATGAAEEEEEEEEKIYNPLKLPLGWDGKPIPYWLYKLHGLGVEYRCEICQDHVYMGRKNFERHFQEARHVFGMRALGLPNTKHFHEITKIEDALSLAEKLKQEGRKEISHAETTEELEDDEGNVYNRKTYEDLKKQGII